MRITPLKETAAYRTFSVEGRLPKYLTWWVHNRLNLTLEEYAEELLGDATRGFKGVTHSPEKAIFKMRFDKKTKRWNLGVDEIKNKTIVDMGRWSQKERDGFLKEFEGLDTDWDMINIVKYDPKRGLILLQWDDGIYYDDHRSWKPNDKVTKAWESDLLKQYPNALQISSADTQAIADEEESVRKIQEKYQEQQRQKKEQLRLKELREERIDSVADVISKSSLGPAGVVQDVTWRDGGFEVVPSNRWRLDHYGNDGEGHDEGWYYDHQGPSETALEKSLNKAFGKGMFGVSMDEKGYMTVYADKWTPESKPSASKVARIWQRRDLL